MKGIRTMEKELGHLKFTKTDEGIRIDITGDGLKDFCGCCCCTDSEKTDGKDKEQCCEPNDKK